MLCDMGRRFRLNAPKALLCFLVLFGTWLRVMSCICALVRRNKSRTAWRLADSKWLITELQHLQDYTDKTYDT